jgi:uncharacterized protein YlzI (FlbEa/FlbD family)
VAVALLDQLVLEAYVQTHGHTVGHTPALKVSRRLPTHSSVISLHRLSPRREPFDLNPDLIATVEACPDTVVALTTGAKVVVAESPREVSQSVRDWRAGILADALAGVAARSSAVPA